ncbi:Sau3AI family type II restriction endonuclease [Planococcus wigleyi]|uniref:Restriction endonuclease n=1 Tax=Planococcus wigleyi TaxID=2762216 RepID=A0ABR8WBV1_9BACL|nr:Sau3AI family type II restriction endonuclease [Planococcus wigleyi]MBD8014494.1 restriction endonuclease [Planococcus wigleyi]
MRANYYDEKNPLSIEEYAKKLIGKSFLDVIHEADLDTELRVEIIDKYGNPRRKGGLGNLLEEVYFGYKANSNQQADFHEAGVELKVSAYELLKKGDFRAGERLVITMISYEKPIELYFYDSKILEKIAVILLVYYLRDKSLGSNLLYPIDFVSLFSPPPEDMEIIKNDYEKIAEKIQEGNAHLLSESDTLYLAASTKGATALKSTVPQYYNALVPARKRAFSLKNSYMTYVLNEYLRKDVVTYEPIVKDIRILKEKSFEDYITERINSHIGVTDAELCRIFDREYNNNKYQWVDLAYRMLGIKSNRAEEFEKANIVVKAIRLEEDGRMIESSSLPSIKLKEFVEEEWEESTLYSYFEQTKFLFVVFRKSGNVYTLKGSQMWNMPLDDLEIKVRDGWEKIRKTIVDGVVFNLAENKNKEIIVKNNLPKKEDNPVIHIRPHSPKRFYLFEDGTTVGNGTFTHGEELPDGRWMTRQSFWINNTYILEQLNEKLKEK